MIFDTLKAFSLSLVVFFQKRAGQKRAGQKSGKLRWLFKFFQFFFFCILAISLDSCKDGGGYTHTTSGYYYSRKGQPIHFPDLGNLKTGVYWGKLNLENNYIPLYIGRLLTTIRLDGMLGKTKINLNKEITTNIQMLQQRCCQ